MEYKGHKKDTGAGIVKDNSGVSFELHKAKSLYSAIFLITGFLSDNEPTRDYLRRAVLELVADISRAERAHFSEREQSWEPVLAGLHGLSALLDASARAGLILESNVILLCAEIAQLIRKIESRIPQSPFFKDGALSPEFFSVPDMTEKPIASVRAFQGSASGKTSSVPAPKEAVPAFGRRSAIIAFVKEHAGATIKEIAAAPLLGGSVSEKTVQRELGSLILEGSVRREGERRWSRYFAL